MTMNTFTCIKDISTCIILDLNNFKPQEYYKDYISYQEINKNAFRDIYHIIRFIPVKKYETTINSYIHYEKITDINNNLTRYFIITYEKISKHDINILTPYCQCHQCTTWLLEIFPFDDNHCFKNNNPSQHNIINTRKYYSTLTSLCKLN